MDGFVSTLFPMPLLSPPASSHWVYWSNDHRPRFSRHSPLRLHWSPTTILSPRPCPQPTAENCVCFQRADKELKAPPALRGSAMVAQTHQTANLCSKLNCASLPRPQGSAGATVPPAGSGEPLGTDAEPGPSLSDGVRGPSHPPGGCSVTRPPSCCVTRPRAWSRTSILNRLASLLAGADAERHSQLRRL